MIKVRYIYPPGGDRDCRRELSYLSNHTNREDVVNRLARIEGHIRGIKRMVEEDKPCGDILIQLSAVRAAVNQVARVVLEDHLESCVLEGFETGNGQEVIDDLKAVIAKFVAQG